MFNWLIELMFKTDAEDQACVRGEQAALAETSRDEIPKDLTTEEEREAWLTGYDYSKK